MGTQRPNVPLAPEIAGLHREGPIAAITCGLREREDEDDGLRELFDAELINLQLRRRKQEVFDHDPELAEATHRRQRLLRHKQDFYRIRLQHELAAHRIIQSRSAPRDVREEEEAASLAALQRLDEYHIECCREIHARFEDELKPGQRDPVARHRDEIRSILERCSSVAISGGHVATIYNRLLFFGLADALHDHVLFAWSAGAMAVSDRIVLYHDDPPQGSGAAEILSEGLGLIPGLVVLPEPEKRLSADRKRVEVFASRFRPRRSFALTAGSALTWQDGQVTRTSGIFELHSDGRIGPFRQP